MTDTATGSDFAACRKFFSEFDNAAVITGVKSDVTVSQRTMLLILRPEFGQDPQVYVLTEETDGDDKYFTLRRRGHSPSIEIEPATAVLNREYAEVLVSGIPLPRNGSLWGWKYRGRITVLIVVYTLRTDETPVPGWSIMPLVGTDRSEWPPFTGQNLADIWSWDLELVDLAPLIGTTQDVVYWAHVVLTDGGINVCTVEFDLPPDPETPVLTAGVYVYHGAIEHGHTIPSMAELLAYPIVSKPPIGPGERNDVGPRMAQLVEH